MHLRTHVFRGLQLVQALGLLFSTSAGWGRNLRPGRHVMRIEALPSGQHGPQDARVLVGQRYHRLLPANALFELHDPLGDRVTALVRRHHGRLVALDQQGAQVLVASFRDVPEHGRHWSFAWARCPARRRTARRS